MDISTILSGLALLVALASLALTLYEKKRNQKRNTAALHLINSECTAVASDAAEYTNDKIERLASDIAKRFTDEELGMWEELNRRFDGISEKIEEIDSEISVFRENIKNLMDGVVPDYNEALKAKNAVDEFNVGLSAIMGFDPLEEVRKGRERKLHGGEVE